VLADRKRPQPEPLAYSVDRAAEISGVSKGSLYEEMRGGRLRSIKRCGRRLILHRDLMAWLEDAPAADPPALVLCLLGQNQHQLAAALAAVRRWFETGEWDAPAQIYRVRRANQGQGQLEVHLLLPSDLIDAEGVIVSTDQSANATARMRCTTPPTSRES
jgi:hypothetical protein